MTMLAVLVFAVSPLAPLSPQALQESGSPEPYELWEAIDAQMGSADDLELDEVCGCSPPLTHLPSLSLPWPRHSPTNALIR